MPVNDPPLPGGALDAAAAGIAEVSADFAAEVGGSPTLGEFLEVLGWAVPVNHDATDGTFPVPLKFKANLKGNKRYTSTEAARTGELNDSVFVDATDHLSALIGDLGTATGTTVTPPVFASAILQVLQTGRIALADIAGQDVRRLTVDTPKRAKPKVGDVLAIPARNGGYHLAVVVAHNRFGMALGVFPGVSTLPRLTAAARQAPRPHPVYTEDHLVRAGTWIVADRDESLLELFPAEPEIYHKPGQWPGVDLGEFGAAESADGVMRLIGPDEANELGLRDGTYRQTHVAEQLQRLLDEQTDSSQD